MTATFSMPVSAPTAGAGACPDLALERAGKVIAQFVRSLTMAVLTSAATGALAQPLAKKFPCGGRP